MEINFEDVEVGQRFTSVQTGNTYIKRANSTTSEVVELSDKSILDGNYKLGEKIGFNGNKKVIVDDPKPVVKVEVKGMEKGTFFHILNTDIIGVRMCVIGTLTTAEWMPIGRYKYTSESGMKCKLSPGDTYCTGHPALRENGAEVIDFEVNVGPITN